MQIDKNIASYFDEDFINIIYKDFKKYGNEIDEKNLEIKERENLDTNIKIFHLNDYKIGSVGYTSYELKEKNRKFETLKYLSNDYNGTNPSYRIACIKILYDKESQEILGFQIANEKNIEKRLEVVKSLIDKNMKLKDLSEAIVYPEDKGSPDILNIGALLAINKNKNLVNIKEVEVENIKELVEKKEFLLDVREEEEYADGHIKNAVNIPLRLLYSKLDTLPKDKDIYVYCRSGHRSLDAVGFLNGLGFDKVHNVNGGFIELSFNEFRRDKGNLEESILTEYNFE